ncbi:hypothetical protein FACS1894132_05840 [Clostridia bacterium]|nr:hypothetical protein FACS1894132_05840 [Clostridia bacterium]
MQTSGKFQFNSADFKKVITNFTLYNLPLFFLTFLTAISQNVDTKASAITASITLLSALVDAMRKFVKDNEGEKNEQN